MRRFFYFILLVSLYSCSSNEQTAETLFTLLSSEETRISFANHLEYNEKFNPYTFRNFYNGAGVALGDINNDGLIDIFFAGNQVENKLYLNKGNFVFEDITQKAGIAVAGIWSTGVSMADINGDGLLDIYVCKSGPLGGQQRHNELFINNGDLTFTEMAKDYGIADEGLSQHAVFFDYDKDGDLDMYLLNNSARSVGVNDLRVGQREVRDPFGGNKLYRNEGSQFVDVSEEAGIYGSAIGYGLGVTVADINKDGWPDLYVSNDFFEKDYLYLNNGDGTFREALEEMMTEISMGSMGADIADLDNDGWADIFVTEMLPNDLQRVKTKTPFEDWDKYQANVNAGYYHQFTRNTLQRNLGYKPGTTEVHFAEVARQSNVHATDWSWGALIFDMDNDGLRDIFVANGIVKDLTDFDFVDYYLNNQNLISQYRKDSVLLTKMIDEFPSVPQQNFLFKNYGDFVFKNIAAEQGLQQLTFSTGAAYADLDNDGDLDLVVNNLNDPAFIYRNNSEKLTQNQFLQFDIKGNFGTKVIVHQGKQSYMGEHNPVKGYMSSVDHRLHFGLGKETKIDSIEVFWPNNNYTILKNVSPNQILTLDPVTSSPLIKSNSLAFSSLYQINKGLISWKHQESDFIDFDRDRLRFHMISNEGPKIAVGDLNNDGLDDFCFPGAKNQPSEIWIQRKDGSFISHQVFKDHALAEDVQALFFDAESDGDLDLYIASGSIEFNLMNAQYQDRLYLNNGKGTFELSENRIPARLESTSFVETLDFNNDGALDLIVGTRSIPFAYGVPGDVRLLKNDGKGYFEDVTNQVAPEFIKIGMSRDAKVVDLNGDGQQEIVIVGEWMPIKVFEFKNGKFQDISEQLGLGTTHGLWNILQIIDLNQDGKPDFLVGNMGLNTRLKTSPSTPIKLFINDFDQNGSIEQILTIYEGVEEYPLILKNALLKQLPFLKKQLLTYDSYKDKRLADLIPENILNNSMVLKAETLETMLFINNGNGKFTTQNLPFQLQSSPVYTIFDDKENLKIWLGGNQSKIKPELGVNMGSYGWVLDYSNSQKLRVLSAAETGVYIPGEIRHIQSFLTPKGRKIAVIRNNDTPSIYQKNN
jgi:enediyne biosynthesis protein E4